jgi:hypothetical protein
VTDPLPHHPDYLHDHLIRAPGWSLVGRFLGRRKAEAVAHAAAARVEAAKVAGAAARNAELKQLTDLRARLQGDDDVKRFARFEEYAKWLFGLTAVVTAVASGVSFSGASPATGLGRQVFAAAQIMGVAGLVLAGFALIPRLNPYNPNNVQSMQNAIERLRESLRTKGRFVWAAGWAFAIALIAAGLSPFVAGVPPIGSGATVAQVSAVDGQGASTLQVQLSGALPFLPAKLQLGGASAGGTCDTPTDLKVVATGQTDIKGAVSLPTTLDPAAATKCLIVDWGSPGGDGSGADAGRLRWAFGPTVVGAQWGLDYSVDANDQLKVAISGIGLAPGEQVLAKLGRGTSASCQPDSMLGGLGAATIDASGVIKLELASKWDVGLCVMAEENPTASPRTDAMNHRWALTAGN